MGAVLSRLAIVGVAFLLCGCVATQGDEAPDGWRRVRPFEEIGISIAMPSGYKAMPEDFIDTLGSKFGSESGDVVVYLEVGLNRANLTKKLGYQSTPVDIDGEAAHIETYVIETDRVRETRRNSAQLRFNDDSWKIRLWSYYSDSKRDEVMAIFRSFLFPRRGDASNNAKVSPSSRAPLGWKAVALIDGADESIYLPPGYHRGQSPDEDFATFISSDGKVEVFYEYGGEKQDVDMSKVMDYMKTPSNVFKNAIIVTHRRQSSHRDRVIRLCFKNDSHLERLWIHYEKSAEQEARKIIDSFRF